MVTTVTSSVRAVSDIWAGAGLPPEALAAVDLPGREPIVPSSFRVATAAQSALALSAMAAAELWYAATGRRQRVTVDMRSAAAEFRSEHYLSVDGAAPRDLWDAIAGAYRSGDGRWVRLHTNFPHHRTGILELLGCAGDRDAVQEALRNWTAFAFEETATEHGLVVAALRSFAEWDAHPQAEAVGRQPVVSIERIGEAPATAAPRGRRPLSGVRVLDLTRIVAGPVCGRSLAAHGADVLRILGPSVPTVEALDIDTGRGKRSAYLDIRDARQREHLLQLVAEADIFVQSYRPGALAHFGLGPEALALIRPGLVYVTLSAYGSDGPWAGKRGFDSLVQTATGFNDAEAQAAKVSTPRPLPFQALDHGSGYLMSFGAMVGLLRRADEGGSWHVQVSLARTGRWLRDLGRVEGGLACPDMGRADVADLLENSSSGYGQLSAVRHAPRMSETPPAWTQPATPFGASEAGWIGKVG